MAERFKNWIENNAHGRRSKLWLFLLAFLDSTVSPVPPDVLLFPVLMSPEARKNWYRYSFIVFVASVFGGVVGYYLGLSFFGVFGKSVISFYGLEDEFLKVSKLFSNNAFWAVFAGAFTPLPYKIFTLTAGFFKVDFFMFLLASVLGRGIRYFLLGIIMRLFGKRIADLVINYIKIATVALIVLVIVIIFA